MEERKTIRYGRELEVSLVVGCRSGQIVGWTDEGRMDEWTFGWMDG